MPKITAPNRGYSGISAGVVFKDGVGETDNPGAIQYFRRHGYEVSGKSDGKYPTAPITEAPEAVFEPEVPAEVHLGSPLRDAAVAPLPKDFLPPTNAGHEEPHGPLVVSPGLHAVGPAPIRPGPVAVDDTDQQQIDETELAKAVLVDGVPVPEALAAIAPQPAPAAPARRATASKPKARTAKKAR